MSNHTKILFLDLDGTLLNDEKEVTAGNREAIDEALSAGHKIVICTGRATSSAVQLAEKLSLTSPGCYAITFNGACIYDLYEGKAVSRLLLSVDEICRILDAANDFGIYGHTYNKTGILTSHDTPALHAYASRTNMTYETTDHFPDQISEGAEKVIIIDFHDHQHLLDFQKYLNQMEDIVADSFFSCDEYLEVVPRGVSKGNAICQFCELFQLPLENTISAGDAQNDISMLQATHIGAVMKNASDSMKAYGNYVTTRDNNHDGIAEIIHTFIL